MTDNLDNWLIENRIRAIRDDGSDRRAIEVVLAKHGIATRADVAKLDEETKSAISEELLLTILAVSEDS